MLTVKNLLLVWSIAAATLLSCAVTNAQVDESPGETKKPTDLVFREFDTRQNGIDISNDGETIFLLNGASDLLLIDADTFEVETKVLDVVKLRGKSLNFSPTGKHFVVEGVFGDLAIYEFDSNERSVSEIQKLKRAGNGVSFARDAPLISYVSRERKLSLFNYESGEVDKDVQLSEFTSDSSGATHLTAKGGQAVFAGSRELLLIDFAADKVLQRMVTRGKPRINRLGTHAVSLQGRDITVLELATGEKRRIKVDGSVKAVDFGRSSDQVVFATRDFLEVRTIGSKSQLKLPLPKDFQNWTALKMTPDGKRALIYDTFGDVSIAVVDIPEPETP